MKKFFYILCLIIFLTGCSYSLKKSDDNEIAQLKKQIDELNQEIENDYFEKKKECASFLTEVKKEIEEEQKTWNLSGITVFYSPSKKTCISAYSKFSYIENMLLGGYSIKDILTNEYIYIKQYSNKEERNILEKIYKDKLEELKK